MQNKGLHANDAQLATMNVFLKNPIEGKGPPSKSFSLFSLKKLSSKQSRKHEILTRSLRKMERTLDTVLRSIGNPGIASGMVSRTPSPTPQGASVQALLADSPSPPASSAFRPQPSNHQSGSPKLHSLPDNSLNPLGLLAEASLANRRAQAVNQSGMVARSTGSGENPKLGVASDNYFKPGTCFCLCIDISLTFFILIRPNDNPPATAIVYRASDSTRNA